MDLEQSEINLTDSDKASHGHNYFLYLLLILLFAPVLFMPMIHEPDTSSYLSFNSQRPPLLPILLNLDKLMTGNQFLLFHIFQIGFMILAIIYLDKWLRKAISTPKYAVIILVSLYFLPIIYHGHFGRMLMSEAISLPLYLILLIVLCKLFLERNVKNAILFSTCVSLLILTRNQFYYLYGFFPLFLLWSWYQRVRAKKIAIFSGIFIATVLLTTLFSCCYHKIVNHEFANTSADGPLLFVQPLYLSKRTDVQYFQDQKEKQAFLATYDNAKQKGLLRDTNLIQHPGFTKGDFLPTYIHFADSFNPIQFQSQDVLQHLGYSPYEADHLMTTLAKTLLRHDTAENLRFYLWKFFYSLGGPLIAIIFFILAVIAFATILKDRKNRVATLALVLLAALFANNLTVSVSEMILPRYLIYSGLSVSLLMVILFCHAATLKKNTHRDSFHPADDLFLK